MTEIGTPESRTPTKTDIYSVLDLFRKVSEKNLRFTNIVKNRLGNNMNSILIQDEVVGDRHFLDLFAHDLSGEDYRAQAESASINYRHTGYNTRIHHSEERGVTFVEVFRGSWGNKS